MTAFAVPADPRLTWRTLGRRRTPASIDGRWPGVVTFSSGRYAIYQGVRAFGIGAGDDVLVPAYHCASAVEPIVRAGARVRFYNVRRDGTVDLGDLAARITDRTRAVLAIHYFGFPQAIAALRRLCDTHGLRLIEDCAHVLAGAVDGRALGSVGDLAIFSWRKFLPMHDGGALVFNRAPGTTPAARAGSWPHELACVKHTVDRLLDGADGGAASVLRAAARLPSRAARRLLTRATPASPPLRSQGDVNFDGSIAALGMSSASRFVAARLGVEAIAAARRANYARLAEGLAGLPGVRPLHADAGSTCPWVFPLIAEDTPGLHRALRATGVPARAWDAVIHPTLSLDAFPDARWLYERLVFLPVHQSLTPKHLATVVNAVGTLQRAADRHRAPMTAAVPGGASED